MARITARLPLPALAIAMAVPAFAQPPAVARSEIPIEALEELYLDCERDAAAGEIRGNDVVRCSIAYEELKRRAFDGDFRRLKAWFDARAATGTGA